MKKRIINTSLLLVFCSIFTYGQDTITTYFNGDWGICSKKYASYYRKSYPDSSGMWIVKDYYKGGQLQMLGKYSDKRLRKQQGPAVFYHFNGKVSMLGQYLNNKRVGLWKKYYLDGSIASMGKMADDDNDSIWTYYNLDGTVFNTMNFINGLPDGESRWYYKSGKLSELAVYKKGLVANKISYDENGTVMKDPPKDCDVEFPGGEKKLNSYLKNNLNYPEELRFDKKEGVVVFHFIVRKDGTIDNIELQKSDEPLFNKEALRVFSLIKFMNPARLHGQIIDRECILPINFSLTGW